MNNSPIHNSTVSHGLIIFHLPSAMEESLLVRRDALLYLDQEFKLVDSVFGAYFDWMF